jgi:hypothetical protein
MHLQEDRVMDKETIGLVLAGLAIGGIAISSGGGNFLGASLEGGQNLKSLRQQSTLQNIISQTNQEALDAQSEIALQRFQNGCVVHVIKAAIQDPTHTAVGQTTVEYQVIREGGNYASWRTDEFYSRGTVLCDVEGGTGIIADDSGTLTDYAYTGAPVGNYVAQSLGGE